MSTYSTVAWVTFFGSKSLASSSRRASGTLATPTRTAVEPIRASWCAPVRMVNRELLPTMGRPIIAVFILTYGIYLKGHINRAEYFFDDAVAQIAPPLGESRAGV